MSPEEYMRNATNTFPPTMTEMQGDQPVRKVPRFPEATTSAMEKRHAAWEPCPLNLCQYNQECSYTPCRATGVPFDPDEQRPLAYYILTKAAEIVTGDREAQHGPKERNFENIAILWRAYIDLAYANNMEWDLTAFDVATMMELLKIARRFAGSGHINPDNYIDGAGYSAIAGEIALNEASPAGEFPRKRAPGENPSF